MATELGLSAGGLRRTVSALSRAGYFTVEGVAEYIYPTRKALHYVNPHLSRGEADAFIRKLRRSTR